MVYLLRKGQVYILENEERPVGSSGLEAPFSVMEIGSSQYDGEKC